MRRFTLQFITTIFILTAVFMPFSANAATTSTANPTGQGLATVGNYAACITGACAALTVLDTIMEFAVLPIAGFIFWITGQMLDQTIQYSLGIYNVINGSGGAAQAIILGWTIIRDIFNMMFIFSIIWIAIETMLDVGKWHGKQILGKIILAAIFINFSFFITEVIIDAGNIFAGWFYNGIITTLGNASNGFSSGATLSASGVSLSAGLATALGVYGVYSGNGSVNLWGLFSLSSATQSIIGTIVRLGVIAFSSYIFAYVSVLFIARTVSLLFSLVTSPIGFAGGVLPQTKEYSKKWWKELKDNVLLAPIFLLFLYVIIAFINTPIFKDANISTVTTSGFSIAQYFKYFLLAFMLLYALRAAKEHAGQLGDAVGKIASQLGQLALGATTGGAALLGKFTVGAAASGVANSKTINEMVAGGGITGALAGAAQKRISGVADYHFNPVGSVLSKETGFKTGKGYTGTTKDISEQQKKAAEAIIPSEKDKKAAVGHINKAEDEAYGDDAKLGITYRTQADRLRRAREAWERDKADTNKYKDYQKQQKSLDTLKTSIKNDPESKIREKIYGKENKALEDLNKLLKIATDSGASKEDTKNLRGQISALKAAMAPEKAAQKAEGKIGFAPGVNIAQALSGKEVNINVPFSDKKIKISEGASKVISGVATVLTSGISKVASERVLKDMNKAVRVAREAVDKEGNKGKEKDISKLIAEIAAEETGESATPPPSSGTSASASGAEGESAGH